MAAGANSHKPLRFCHFDRVNCGLGYSGSALAGETSSVQGVLSGGVASWLPVWATGSCGPAVACWLPVASAVAASRPATAAATARRLNSIRASLSWAEKGQSDWKRSRDET
jgi:hypothetical protein